MLLAAIGIALVLIAIAIGWLSYAAGGPLGVVWVGIGILVCTALGARLLIARPPAPPEGDGPASFRPENPPFPTFKEIVSEFSWLATSHTFYDRVVRPRLWRLLVDVTAYRHGERAARDRTGLKTRIGSQLWPLVDPDAPESRDPAWGRAKGPEVNELADLVDRIERI
jgi:hypothetical protein